MKERKLIYTRRKIAIPCLVVCPASTGENEEENKKLNNKANAKQNLAWTSVVECAKSGGRQN